MTNCRDDGIIFKVNPCAFGKGVTKSMEFAGEEVDSWPLKVTFLTLMLNMSAKGPAMTNE